MTIVFDIETAGRWEDLDDVQREYLARHAPEGETAEARAGLSAWSGRVVCIGMLELETDRRMVLYDGGPGASGQEKEGAWTLVAMDEAGLLKTFWTQLAKAERRGAKLVTFNGRSFDGPFLMQRSAVLGLAPSRNLVPYRYSFAEHCDLLEVLTFFGVVPRVSLDFLCRTFGIDTPKGAIDGSKVDEYFKAGRAKEIATYCAGDVEATAALYQRLRETLLPVLDARG